MIDLYKKNKELINYLIFGFLTTIVSLLVYYGLTFIIFNPHNVLELQITNIISWFAGVVFAYITNRKYVFESKNKKIVKESSKFLLSRITTLLIDMAIMGIFVSILGYNDKVIKIISQIVVIVSNYIFSKLFVFKSK